ncbi:phosphate/phosphite/phosphonate ABC transporter substrate-binding protein [Microbacterium faecale]|nr:phosphate/phosphite/phosphonate ABC transporter substrate-binding protein [Microbacterium faecale]
MISTRTKRTSLVALAGVGLLALAGCAGTAADETADSAGGNDWPDTLTFAQIPSESATSIAESNAPIIDALEQELGLTIEMQEATSYAAVIEALRAGQVDIGSMGPFSYVVAADSGAGVVPVGALADSPDEAASYRSYGIVPAGSDITSLADFAGKNVCFVDQTSTSGFLFPSAGLLEEGIDPTSDVEAVFAGGHDASALSVADGTCDAGFAFDTMVTHELIGSGQLEEGALEVVWESEDIPNSPTVVSDQLPQDLQDEITRVFQEQINKPALVEMGICDSEEDCELPEESAYGFIAVEDSLYDGIRAVCDITESESCVA